MFRAGSSNIEIGGVFAAGLSGHGGGASPAKRIVDSG
jgi:hypothetical protein